MIIITEILIRLFIESNELSINYTQPIKPPNYLQEILLPEVATRLIAQDMEITLDKARDIMEDSVRFGVLVHKECATKN